MKVRSVKCYHDNYHYHRRRFAWLTNTMDTEMVQLLIHLFRWGYKILLCWSRLFKNHCPHCHRSLYNTKYQFFLKSSSCNILKVETVWLFALPNIHFRLKIQAYTNMLLFWSKHIWAYSQFLPDLNRNLKLSYLHFSLNQYVYVGRYCHTTIHTHIDNLQQNI